MRTKFSPTEFIEDMLSRLVNSWMAQNADQPGVSHNEAIGKFGNLSVSALYQLIQTNIYPYLLQTPITREIVCKSLRAYSYTHAEQDLVNDVIPPKTPLKKWLKQKRDEGIEISPRLYNVLLRNIGMLGYVEYITKEEFCLFRRGRRYLERICEAEGILVDWSIVDWRLVNGSRSGRDSLWDLFSLLFLQLASLSF